MGLLSKTTDDYEDGVKSFGFWELHDEIHGEGRPWFSGDWKRLKETKRLVTGGFVTLTGVATINIIVDFLTHAIPNIISGNEFKSSGATWMASSEGIVTTAENFKFFVT